MPMEGNIYLERSGIMCECHKVSQQGSESLEKSLAKEYLIREMLTGV